MYRGVRFSAEQSNTLLDIIKARRDVRGNLFTDEPISDSELDSIMEAGLYAPSVGYSPAVEVCHYQRYSYPRESLYQFQKELQKE